MVMLWLGGPGWISATESDAEQPAVVRELEYKVKAGFLFNFAKFVQWPGNDSTLTNAFRIGVLDDGEALAVLETALAGKTVQGRTIEVRGFKPTDDLKQCEMLFFARSQEGHYHGLLKSLGEAPVLTVSEVKDFARNGGCINFVQVGENIRFVVNLKRAEAAGLKISSKLASMATIVPPEAPQK